VFLVYKILDYSVLRGIFHCTRFYFILPLPEVCAQCPLWFLFVVLRVGIPSTLLSYFLNDFEMVSFSLILLVSLLFSYSTFVVIIIIVVVT